MALDEDEVVRLGALLLADFSERHPDYPGLIARHGLIVAAQLSDYPPPSPARAVVLGATFTAEFATEAAALCNPSAVLHPDQGGVVAGQVRLALSLRAIGEGHVSSIAFVSALVGPGERWSFEPRTLPVTPGAVSPGDWRKVDLAAVLADQGRIDELTTAVLHALPARFTGADLGRVMQATPTQLLHRAGSAETVLRLQSLVSSDYEVAFDPSVPLDRRILLPSSAEESNGMEDARITRFVEDDGTVDYRATYTAYDGHRIASRRLTSPDLRRFRAHRLAGPATRDKGMALFPRRVGGRQLALCRTDGEALGLTHSSDGRIWEQPEPVYPPTASWELVQVGNCGPPIETERGWLVLTHGVGPMRAYKIGALLLDLDQPTRVAARLARPLLEAPEDERDGYVPDVVYSCGAVVHDTRLWLPYGIDDARIGVAWTPLAELLDAMVATG